MEGVSVGPPSAFVQTASELRDVVMPISRRIRRELTSPLGPTELSVFGVIHRRGPVRLSELAEAQGLSPPAVSRAINALEDAGFAERFVERADRRVVFARTTAHGVDWLESEGAHLDQWLAARIERLQPADVDAIVMALPALARLMEELA